ncbi:MAG TPA: adenosine deaminase [Thermoanaerobaculia bacterium]|jgi:adenosine deaminase|nr:adenosine deaminase [Thermoanaerobaculia bacterium]
MSLLYPFADCHLHFEGSLPLGTLEALGRRAGHRFADRAVFETERAAILDRKGFLEFYAEVCRLFGSPRDYGEAARAIARSVAAGGASYTEIYVSPEIPARFGFDPGECLTEIDRAFRDEEAQGGARCRILLDAVRQWGPESAERVLDLHEKTRLPSVVGFGLGGDELSLPATAFAGVYLRARALGLRTSVHAGEWGGAESLTESLDLLRPDRIDHGIAAVEDPHLLARLVEESTPLWVAPTSNHVTGAVPTLEEHPLPRLLDAGVCVAIGADDPLIFATTTAREHGLLREKLGFGERTMRLLAENSWRAAFCPPAERDRALAEIGGRRSRRGPPQPSVTS